jgi:hypothetical protein
MFPRPTGKKPGLDDALEVLADLAGAPVHLERLDDPLLDHLLVGVLSQHTSATKAKEALRAISAAYLDLNELRVSGRGEIEKALEEFVAAEKLQAASWDLRMALQDVYDATHGLDLEPLRGREPEDLKHFATRLPNTAGGPAALVFQLAVGEKHLALGPLESRLLDRLGMLPRAATPQRVRQAVERLIKPAERLRFAWVTGATARLFERDFDPAHPFCKLLVECRARELVEREKAAKAEEVRRKAEEKRLAIEEAKRLKLEAIERKKREAEERKKALEAEKKRKKDEAIKAAQQKKLAEQARRLEEKRKQEEARKAAVAAEKAKKQAALKAKADKAKADREKAEKAEKAKKLAAEKAKKVAAEKAKKDAALKAKKAQQAKKSGASKKR